MKDRVFFSARRVGLRICVKRPDGCWNRGSFHGIPHSFAVRTIRHSQEMEPGLAIGMRSSDIERFRRGHRRDQCGRRIEVEMRSWTANMVEP